MCHRDWAATTLGAATELEENDKLVVGKCLPSEGFGIKQCSFIGLSRLGFSPVTQREVALLASEVVKKGPNHISNMPHGYVGNERPLTSNLRSDLTSEAVLRPYLPQTSS